MRRQLAIYVLLNILLTDAYRYANNRRKRQKENQCELRLSCPTFQNKEPFGDLLTKLDKKDPTVRLPVRWNRGPRGDQGPRGPPGPPGPEVTRNIQAPIQKPKAVAFQAYLYESHSLDRIHLPINKSHTSRVWVEKDLPFALNPADSINIGNGYEPATGRFKAPLSGVYEFHVQIANQVDQLLTHKSSELPLVKLMRKRAGTDDSPAERVKSIYTHSAVWTTALLHIMMNLKRGDQVWLVLAQKNIYGYAYSSFSGRLLNEERDEVMSSKTTDEVGPTNINDSN